MKVQSSNNSQITLALDDAEVGILRQALIEICHGVDFDDAEFEARMPADRKTVTRLLDELIAADDAWQAGKSG